MGEVGGSIPVSLLAKERSPIEAESCCCWDNESAETQSRNGVWTEIRWQRCCFPHAGMRRKPPEPAVRTDPRSGQCPEPDPGMVA
ncbi:hypothetical protein MHYP_G00164380 [Metynnis hypsauchen]